MVNKNLIKNSRYKLSTYLKAHNSLPVNDVVVRFHLEQPVVILSIIKFLRFFCEKIRNYLLFNNYMKLHSFGKLDYSKLNQQLSSGI